MLAISIRQPWAWAIMCGPGKNIENRTWPARWQRAAGERIAIHASKRDRWDQRGAWDDRIIRAFSSTHGLTDGLVPMDRDDQFAFGAILGTVLVLDVHPADDCCDPWGDEQRRDTMSRDAVVHLELTAPRPCEPIPCRGALGLWRLPEHVELELREAVGR